MAEYEANGPDRSAPAFAADDDLAKEAVGRATQGVMATFETQDGIFRCILLRRTPLDPPADANDAAAAAKGFTELASVCALCESDRVLAVWEFYATNAAAPYLSKAIEVDPGYQKRGIGSAFWKAMQAADFLIAPSDIRTTAGASLLNAIISGKS